MGFSLYLLYKKYFMRLKINLPFSMWNYKLSGVYKILFEDGCFYIGCSKHLRSRATSWEGIFNTKKGVPGKDIGAAIINKIRENINATFDIVELCAVADLKDKESFYLDKYKDDNLMLSSNDNGAWKAVLQYKPDGSFIKKHYSIKSAARYVKSTLSSIQRVLNGERKTCKGMIFIYEHEYHKRRTDITKARTRVVERKGGRDVLMLNKDGEIIKRFKKITEAAKEVGVSSKNVSRALNKFQQTAGGYSFRYA